jgi:hypothetical protein
MESFTIPQKAVATRWYQEPWNCLVLGGPLLVVCASIFTAFLAYKGADQVVAEDYYRQGLAINKDIDRDHAAAVRHIAADLRYDGATGIIVLKVQGSGEMPAALSLSLADASGRSENETVRRIELKQGNDGAYRGALAGANGLSALGRDVVYVKIEAQDWRLTQEWREPAFTALQIRAAK